ncbi:alanine racemase [Phenylobacterium sp. J367]|uniref:alanine racemase n=1 Tax=Phenylobacterium sp. J367 TaxID=2898435 RepID=UPI002151A9DA|nr:alanine racemase [Phenylobacterium sp. J367]MCR5880285.1 alanine racemase [Phenylobacterium sp. J367]
MPEPAQARLTIDLDALAHNLSVLTAEAAGAEVAPVVKSDGYGLGAGPLACRLWAEGARSFFVARLHEGEALRRELGPERDSTIYVLDGVTAGAAPRLAAALLTPVIASLPQAAAASVFARQSSRRWPVALQVDTGMNRQGLTLEEARALAATPDGLRDLDVTLVMSHLGSATAPADRRNVEQLARFNQAIALFPEARRSLAASAGAFLGGDYRFDMVRPGISLYGGGPEERPDARLRAVATLTAPILDIRNFKPGDRIGYGAAVTVDRPMRAAIVAAGYTDGVVRGAMGKGHAWFRGAHRPLVIVTMDLIAIEIGDQEATVGEQVELLGPNALVDDLATAAGTVAHEVLVRLSTRAERTYLGAS